MNRLWQASPSPAYTVANGIVRLYEGRRFSVRRGWGRRCLLGCCAIGLGAVILLALIVPAGFWWFLAGAALIAGGIWYMRCC